MQRRCRQTEQLTESRVMQMLNWRNPELSQQSELSAASLHVFPREHNFMKLLLCKLTSAQISDLASLTLDLAFVIAFIQR